MSRRLATVVALTMLVLGVGATTASADVHLQEQSCQGGRAATEGYYGEVASADAEAGQDYGETISGQADDLCNIRVGRPPESDLPPLNPYR